MKKRFKKNQVIITSLAVLIAVAGYLNFADIDLGNKKQAASTETSSILDELEYDLSDETALLEENAAASDDDLTLSDSPGEAVLTSSTNFAIQAKLSREQIRSQNKADLQSIVENSNLSDEAKQDAVRTIVNMTEVSEKEAAAEMLLEAKGFENVIVNLTGETADVVVPDAYLEDSKRAQIEDIVKRKTGIVETNIVITSLSQSAENKKQKEAGNTDGADSLDGAAGNESTGDGSADYGSSDYGEDYFYDYDNDENYEETNADPLYEDDYSYLTEGNTY